jgi:hypothetical protein
MLLMGMVAGQADIAMMRNFCEKRFTALLQLGKMQARRKIRKSSPV